MSAAVLFRGDAHREPGRSRPWGIDWRRGLESHRRFLLEPARERYGRADVFLASYRTPLWPEVVADYAPAACEWLEPSGTQRQTFLAGLDAVLASDHQKNVGYRLVVTCRFDLELLCCPFSLPGFAPDRINFLWREWNEENWKDHNRVPDAIHMLPGHFLRGFRDGVAHTPSEHCMHLVYRPVAARVGVGNLNVVIPDGFIDSNTDHQANPVYKILRVH